MEIAAHFGLCELLREQDLGTATKHWVDGNELLAQIHSRFMERWQRSLAGKMERTPITIWTNKHMSWKEAQEAFALQFLEYQTETIGGSTHEVADRLGVDRSYVYELKKKMTALKGHSTWRMANPHAEPGSGGA